MTRHNRLIKFSLVAAVATATLWPAESSAQQRQRSTSPRTGTAVPADRSRYYRPNNYYRPNYYRPYYYRPYYGYYPGYYGSGFYNPYFWGGYGFGLGFGYGYGPAYGYGYGPAYGYGYGQYPYPPYYYGAVYDNGGSARLQVTPRNAQVYIDGYFVGVVDDFDGYLQRLNVEAGEHELQLYLEGYRPFTQKVLFGRGSTVKLIHAMQPLGPGESAGVPPKPDESLRSQPARGVQGRMERPGPPPRGGESRQSEFGSLLLRVRPADAEILVDGEAWQAPQGEDQFVIELAEGAHRIEVRKDGFQTYGTTVRVRRGESVRLNVSLTSGGLTGEF